MKLETKKAALQKEINKMDADLVELMAEIKTLEGDISDKESDIETTKAELTTAQEDQQKQYDSMKTRIAYIYENRPAVLPGRRCFYPMPIFPIC